MAKKIEIHQEPKPEGTEVSAIPTLNGKTVELVRNGKKTIGVLISKDKQGPSDNLSFQWKHVNGSACISDVTKEEIEKLLNDKQSS